MTNKFQGLARGPIDHTASSVINSIANDAITMGSVVLIDDSAIASNEILPRVVELAAQQGTRLAYGIVVGGDTDGIYGDGSAATGPENQAAEGVGQGVVVVTQGRCPARVSGTNSGGDVFVGIGNPLTQSAVSGVLEQAITGDNVVAFALNRVESGDLDMIAVDVQREGIL